METIFLFGVPFLITLITIIGALKITNWVVRKKSTPLSQTQKSSAIEIVGVAILAGFFLIFVIYEASQAFSLPLH